VERPRTLGWPLQNQEQDKRQAQPTVKDGRAARRAKDSPPQVEATAFHAARDCGYASPVAVGQRILLNGTTCRLRDIQEELVMGTGLDRKSYALIEQGRIRQILEQPAVMIAGQFEEAAGITGSRQEAPSEARLEDPRSTSPSSMPFSKKSHAAMTRLKRQASTAERYGKLRMNARKCACSGFWPASCPLIVRREPRIQAQMTHPLAGGRETEDARRTEGSARHGNRADRAAPARGYICRRAAKPADYGVHSMERERERHQAYQRRALSRH